MVQNSNKFEEKYLNEIESLARGDHYNPHGILGLQDFFTGEKVIRVWKPGAENVFIEYLGQIVEMRKIHAEGFFEYVVPDTTGPLDYKVYHEDGSLSYDPYTFLPILGEFDQYLFANGTHYELYKVMGARLIEQQSVKGVAFTVWAPNAKRVSLIADFNHWNGLINPMRVLGNSGIWELFVPGLEEWQKYKFEIKTKEDQVLIKTDPFGKYFEYRPSTAAVVYHTESFEWEDEIWMVTRKENKSVSKPVNIYEVHLGSWQKNNGNYLSYKELAHRLVDYCKMMNYTHLELMPVMEHPLDESWGYQVTGYYAPTSRFGTPADFQYFVNHCHKNNIGVILDWVPGHFPTDTHSLGRFDGTALFEHEDPKQGLHPHWFTYIFNFDRKEVTNFLLASALFWIEVMHIDGLRVDAVASMIYLDYGREKGEWIPNIYGENVNLGALEFLKHVNAIVHQRNPGSLIIAEESTSFTGISHPLDQGGLGFDMKWNMGWMNDTLRYFSYDSIYRHYHHNDLTFGLLYAFSERFNLVLSHDEVVHGKKSLIGRMKGDLWQQFANLRLLLSYMICQPGKKLLFMGGEIAQWNEWNSSGQIEWELLNFDTHSGVQTMVKELNLFYLNHPALWEKDFEYKGFEWVDFHDRQNCIISYLRKGNNQTLLCVHNFTPMTHDEYFLPSHKIRKIKEVFNSDDQKYGGSGKGNSKTITSNGNGVTIQVAPLATQIFYIIK